MKKCFGFILTFLVIFGPSVFAQDFSQESIIISPQSIVVNPLPQFEVEVSVDRDPSGEAIPSYDIGDNITINVTASEDAYVYLFDVRSNGEIQQIIPNRYGGEDNFIRANQTRRFPPPNAGFTFGVDGPIGLDKVIAVASKTQLDVSTLANFQNDPNFASSNIGEESFARSLSIVVTPLPQEDWVTDTASFYVVDNSPAPPPPYGTVSVNSNPTGGLIYVDGQFRGYTPYDFGELVGRHTLRIELGDYQVFEEEIRVRSNQTIRIDVSLVRVVQHGTVSFVSQPNGAEVFVGGNYVGTTPTGVVSYNSGSYQATFKLGSYSESTVNFNVSPNSNQTVNATLLALQGVLVVRSNINGARVFVDGQDYNTIPGGTGRIDDLPAGRHQLTVVALGYDTFIEEFTIRPGQTTEINAHQSRR